MRKKLMAVLAALATLAGGMALSASPAQAAITCVDRDIPRVEFRYDKPFSDDDTILHYTLFYKKCSDGDRMWVKPEMSVMTWSVQGGTTGCRQFDFVHWEVRAHDSFGHSMLKTWNSYCDSSTSDTRAVSYAPKNVPRFYYAKTGTWPDLAPKWNVQAEIVREGPVINSSFEKKGAFLLQ